MNLIVDVGNTAIKLAAVGNGAVVDTVRVSSWDDDSALQFLSKHQMFDFGIASSVRSEGYPEFIDSFITANLLVFTHKTPVPIGNDYETPNTLGLDRLAAAVGANNIFPNTNVLVVDCGTAITVDFVSAEGRFEGGNISLGLNTRFKALSSFTSKLPLVDIADGYPLMGKNTTDAIRAGVLNSAVFEMNSYIDLFSGLHPDLKVIFTGGDAFFFDGKLKNTIFVVPNLVVQGLNRILEYNV
jgi:type III pantothenate kinase